MISSYVGENKEFERQYLAGELELEFNPQGTMAERIRAGGAGIYGFFTKTGAGTVVAEGKEQRVVDGETYVLETGLVADVSLVKAWKGDTEGNLIYRKTARNFNPNMATAGRVTVAEVEMLVEAGELDPDQIHTPGIFVQTHHQRQPVSEADREAHGAASARRVPMPWSREDLAARAARELQDGFYVNLGIGIPTLVANYIAPGLKVVLQSENGMLGIGPFPYEGEEDPDLINAGKQTVTALAHELVFLLRRQLRHDSRRPHRHGRARRHGSRARTAISPTGWCRAKWSRAWAGPWIWSRASRRIVVVMEHTSKDGESKFKPRCELPLTGVNVVDMLITDLAVFSRASRQERFKLIETAPGVTREQVRRSTTAEYLE